jgi:hypothetical protein
MLLVLLLVGCESSTGASIDAAPPEALCPDCQPGEICVLSYDGLCGVGPGRCVASACTSCTPDCDQALCGGSDAGPGHTCQATPCTTLPANVFACYGP